MEGSFSTIPLSDVLEMVHANRGTGVLHLTSGKLPLQLQFEEGEVVGGGILDWEGFEAISTFPLHPEQGRFRFEAGQVKGLPLMPFKAFMGEWARMNDQWARFRSVLDSPSRVLETPRAVEPFAVFVGGKSVRAAAKSWGVPLIIATERAWRGLREGDLTRLRKYAWFALRIRHPSARRTQAGIRDPKDLTVLLDGSRNLGELIQAGLPIARVRDYLIERISSGELQAAGRGWILRDLLWELEAEQHPPK
ncbi:MAG: DUF4388 domain-containing protein [Meiothermus sp.]|uniref:DUF4388 domain-containing protein n=1 Tax=Meiothermus sp. TaxID=1955249 RepID=UPI0025D35B86|nr:DUF4388 domain-containing protein [Meiothermus sp.]MCS7067131.1 DUF4388 domain-containing protein [Meiothermus sp.]MDW8425209.1 DUF4388 domain-containing protein [Meiothermus sp.]